MSVRKVKTAEHPTHRTLLDHGVALANEFGMYEFTVEQVLTVSGISKGSLYHHFDDFPDFVECVQVRLFAEYVAQDIRAIENALEAATDLPKFKELARAITRAAIAPERVQSRLQRARIIGATAGHDRFASRIAHEQQLLNEQFKEVLRIGQNRHWVNPEISAPAVALLIQAYSFGYLLNNVAGSVVDEDEWVALIDMLLSKLLFEF